MAELLLHKRKVESVFHLLGEHENDITYSVAWALAQSRHFLSIFVHSALGISADSDNVVIRLQQHEKQAGIGYEVGSKNPPGVPITTPGGPVTHTASLGPFQKNLTTGETSVNYSLGLVIGIGAEVAFNPKKFNDLASKCDIMND